MISSYITPEVVEEIKKGIADFFAPKWENIQKALYELQLTEGIKNTLIDKVIAIILLAIAIYLIFHWDRLNDKYHFFNKSPHHKDKTSPGWAGSAQAAS